MNHSRQQAGLSPRAGTSASRELVIDFDQIGERASFGACKPLILHREVMIRSFSGTANSIGPDLSSGAVVKVVAPPYLDGLCAFGASGIAITTRLPCRAVHFAIRCTSDHAVFLWDKDTIEPVAVPHAAGTYELHSDVWLPQVTNIAIGKPRAPWGGNFPVEIGPITLTYDT